jgi:hypothetical protein
MTTTRTSTRSCKKPTRFDEEVFVAGANNKHTVGRSVDAGQAVCRLDGSEDRMSASEAAEVARVEMYEEIRTPAIDSWNDARLSGDEDAMDGFEEWLCLQEKDDTWGDKEEPMTKVLSSQEKSELAIQSRAKKENDRRFREDLCDRGMCADNCVLCREEGGGAGAADESEVEEEEWAPDSDGDEEEEDDWLDTTDKLYWGEIMPLPAIVRWFSLKNGIWRRCCYAKKIGEDRWLVAPLDWLEECPEKMVDEQEWLDNSIGVLTNTELHVNEYIVGDFEEAFGRKAEPSRWMAMPDDE